MYYFQLLKITGLIKKKYNNKYKLQSNLSKEIALLFLGQFIEVGNS